MMERRVPGSWLGTSTTDELVIGLQIGKVVREGMCYRSLLDTVERSMTSTTSRADPSVTFTYEKLSAKVAHWVQSTSC